MRNIVVLNHKQKQCGVYQYGARVGKLLKQKNYNFVYLEVESEAEFFALAKPLNPLGIIYNYHPLTMAWCGRHSITAFPNAVHLGLHHEGSKPHHLGFDAYLIVDSTYTDNEKNFAVPRPLFEYNGKYEKPEIPTIASFGFGFGNKGFARVVKAVNDEYDEAIVKLHIPRAYFGDRNGEASAGVLPGCHNEVKKPGIKLEITHDFLEDEQLLEFLASNTANVFLYDEMLDRGLSSVIDYAISVKTPLVINNSHMFRHIYEEKSIIYNNNLKEIIALGNNPMQKFRDKWSQENFINRYESILNTVIARRA